MTEHNKNVLLQDCLFVCGNDYLKLLCGAYVKNSIDQLRRSFESYRDKVKGIF